MEVFVRRGPRCRIFVREVSTSNVVYWDRSWRTKEGWCLRIYHCVCTHALDESACLTLTFLYLPVDVKQQTRGLLLFYWIFDSGVTTELLISERVHSIQRCSAVFCYWDRSGSLSSTIQEGSKCVYRMNFLYSKHVQLLLIYLHTLCRGGGAGGANPLQGLIC